MNRRGAPAPLLTSIIMKNILSMSQFGRKDIESYFSLADRLSENNNFQKKPFTAGLFFFEESTRTELGFEAAAYKLGGKVLKLRQTKVQDRMSAAESIEDTIRVLQSYVDLMVIRHPDDNIFKRILPLASKPIINGGNGKDEHPTQTLTDLFTIKRLKGKIDGLKVAIVGDLKYMRTSHSLAVGLSEFKDVKITLVSPIRLNMPGKYLSDSRPITQTEKLDLKDQDIIYITGFAPKTASGYFGESIRKKYQINNKVLKNLKPDAKILCPLPRIDEITTEVDNTKFAKYFEQSDLGLYIRMAVLKVLL